MDTPARKVVLIVCADQSISSELAAFSVRVGLDPSVSESVEHSADLVEHSAVRDTLAAIVCGLEQWAALRAVLATLPPLLQTFVCVLGEPSVKSRLELYREGAQQVTSSVSGVGESIRQVAAGLAGGGPYSCPQCGLGGLHEDLLRRHLGLYHAAGANSFAACPVCAFADPRTPLVVHLNESHGPPETREPPPAPYPAFAWVVCRRKDGRFLIVNEPAGMCSRSRGPGYWLPAGRVDAGEGLVDGARREALEEGGVAVRVTGVLRFMPEADGDAPPHCLRVVFLAEPEDEERADAKAVPDYESVGACWVDARELEALDATDYRHPDPAELYPAVASGALRPHALNEAFEGLEAVVRRLTSGDRAARAELGRAWERVRAAYPEEAFR